MADMTHTWDGLEIAPEEPRGSTVVVRRPAVEDRHVPGHAEPALELTLNGTLGKTLSVTSGDGGNSSNGNNAGQNAGGKSSVARPGSTSGKGSAQMSDRRIGSESSATTAIPAANAAMRVGWSSSAGTSRARKQSGTTKSSDHAAGITLPAQ